MRKNGVEILKDVIFETKAKYGHFYIVIVGDLNLRIANEQNFMLEDDIRFSQNMDYYPVDLFNISRKSRDEIVNNFGLSLLFLCRELGVHTLNGRNGKDLNGEFTYLSRAGASVIDYTIVSTDIYKNFFKFEVQIFLTISRFMLP